MNHQTALAMRWLLLAAVAFPALRSTGQQHMSCAQFYHKENFAAIAIAAKPVLTVRNLDAESYAITYQEEYRQRRTLRLYKNRNGQNLINFVKPGDLIKKLKGQYSVLVIRQLNGALDVQSFELGCEE